LDFDFDCRGGLADDPSKRENIENPIKPMKNENWITLGLFGVAAWLFYKADQQAQAETTDQNQTALDGSKVAQALSSLGYATPEADAASGYLQFPINFNLSLNPAASSTVMPAGTVSAASLFSLN
jgi:hypothetical protein